MAGSFRWNFIALLPFSRSPTFIEAAAMSHMRRSEDGDGRVMVTSPAERGPLGKASLDSAAAERGYRRPLNERPPEPLESSIEQLVAPAAIERALSVYQQLQERDWSVVLQARKILTRRIYAMVDQGESDEHRLTVGGLTHLKSVERDHAIKSASDSQNTKQR